MQPWSNSHPNLPADSGAPAPFLYLQVDATPKAPYSVDENLYHTSYESGMLEDPMAPPLKEMFKMVRPAFHATVL